MLLYMSVLYHILSDMHSYYHLKVDYFPIKACPVVFFYSSYTTIFQFIPEHVTSYLFIVPDNIVELPITYNLALAVSFSPFLKLLRQKKRSLNRKA